MKLARVAGAAIGTGVGGWLLENLLIKRYDAIEGLPVLPVYASGGALIAIVSPFVRDLDVLERFVVYAALLTALEAGAGEADKALGRSSWDYGGGRRTDAAHAIMWGLFGLLVDGILRTAFPQGVDK